MIWKIKILFIRRMALEAQADHEADHDHEVDHDQDQEDLDDHEDLEDEVTVDPTPGHDHDEHGYGSCSVTVRTSTLKSPILVLLSP